MVLALVLAGCAGGGSGGGGPAGDAPPAGAAGTPAGTPGDPPFTSFAAIQPNQTVVLSGMSQTAMGTQSGPSNNLTMGPLVPVAVDTTGTTLSLTYDGAGALSGVQISSPNSSMSFSRGAGDNISCSSSSCVITDSSGARGALLANSKASGWNYQTFGYWGTDLPEGGLQMSALSAGSATPANAVPLTGAGNFIGQARGVYIDAAGAPFATLADMNANVNFSGRSIAFATSNTTTENTNTKVQASNTGLNLSGTFTYAAGGNQFSGSVASANGSMTGTSTGRFYGPSAQEIGGVYTFIGSGSTSMLGACGGKR